MILFRNGTGLHERIVMLGYSVLISWIWRIAMSGATLAWMGLIFYLSSLSQAEVSRPLETPAIAWLGMLRSYAAHVVLYGILASLVQASLWGWKPDYRHVGHWPLLRLQAYTEYQTSTIKALSSDGLVRSSMSW